MSTAAVVIIGDEILSGKFRDENGPFLTDQLRARGVALRRLVVVSDDIPQIAAEVARCAADHDWVLTTGGVGPTHDDVTLEAIAVAFDRPLELRAELVALMERFEMTLDDATRRMATLPQGCELVVSADSVYPVLRLENVFILPGVPRLVQRKFADIAPFLGTHAPLHTARVRASSRESEVAAALAVIDTRHPAVAIGSYPRFGEEWRLVVTLESDDPVALERARAEVRAALGAAAEDAS